MSEFILVDGREKKKNTRVFTYTIIVILSLSFIFVILSLVFHSQTHSLLVQTQTSNSFVSKLLSYPLAVLDGIGGIGGGKIGGGGIEPINSDLIAATTDINLENPLWNKQVCEIGKGGELICNNQNVHIQLPPERIQSYSIIYNNTNDSQIIIATLYRINEDDSATQINNVFLKENGQLGFGAEDDGTDANTISHYQYVVGSNKPFGQIERGYLKGQYHSGRKLINADSICNQFFTEINETARCKWNYVGKNAENISIIVLDFWSKNQIDPTIVIYNNNIKDWTVDGGGIYAGTDKTDYFAYIEAMDFGGMWMFDMDNNQTAWDVSRNYNDGAYEDGAITGEGRYDTGAKFNASDGSNSKITISNPYNLDGTGWLTISAWVKIGKSANDEAIAGRTSEVSSLRQSYGLVANGFGCTDKAIAFVNLDDSGAGDYFVCSNTDITDNQWHMITETWQEGDLEGNLKIFIDGVEEANITTGNYPLTTPDIPFTIGNYQDIDCFQTSCSANGSIDWVWEKNEALAPSTIQNIYNEQYNMFESGGIVQSHNINQAETGLNMTDYNGIGVAIRGTKKLLGSTLEGQIYYWNVSDGYTSNFADIYYHGDSGEVNETDVVNSGNPGWGNGIPHSGTNINEDMGIYENGIVFDLANSDYIDTNMWFGPGTNTMSYTMWIKPNDVSGVQVITAPFSMGYGGIALAIDSGKFAVTYSNDDCSGWDNTIYSNDNIETGKWYYVTVTYSYYPDYHVYLYINGVRQDDVGLPSVGICWDETKNITVGTQGANYFNGTLDEIMLYSSYELGPYEISREYNQGHANWQGSDSYTITTPENFTNDTRVSNGLVSWWRFDGDTKDSMPSGNNGTLVDNANVDNLGMINKGLSLDGDGDYVSFPYSDSLVQGRDQLTVTAWVNPKSVDTMSANAIAGQREGCDSNFNWLLYSSDYSVSDGKALFVVNNDMSSNTVTESTTTLPLNEWSMITGTYDGSKVKIYINGNFEGESDLTGNVNNNNVNTLVGWESCGNNYENGSIDEFRIYNKSLSQEEIYNIYTLTASEYNYTIPKQTTNIYMNYYFGASSYLFYTPFLYSDTAYRYYYEPPHITSNDTIISNIAESPASPTEYNCGAEVDITAQIVNELYGIDTVIITVDNVNYTVTNTDETTWTAQFFGELGTVGTHHYSWWANSTTGIANSSNEYEYVVEKGEPSISISFDPSNPVVYPTETTATGNWGAICGGADDVTTQLYRDGSPVSNPDVQTLAVNNYEYHFVSSEGENYSAVDTYETLYVTGTPETDLTANLYATPSWSIIEGQTSTVEFTSNINECPGANVWLERDSSIQSNPDVENLPHGTYLYNVHGDTGSSDCLIDGTTSSDSVLDENWLEVGYGVNNTACDNFETKTITAKDSTPIYSRMCEGVTSERSYVYKQYKNSKINLPVYLKDGSPSNNSVICTIDLIYPNSTIINITQSMTYQGGGLFGYDAESSEQGDYTAQTKCSYGNEKSFTNFRYTITPSGYANMLALFVIIISVTYFVGFYGFFGKHVWTAVLGGMAMIALGLFTINNGVDIYRNSITDIFSWTTIGLGAIFSIIAAIELIEENM